MSLNDYTDTGDRAPKPPPVVISKPKPEVSSPSLVDYGYSVPKSDPPKTSSPTSPTSPPPIPQSSLEELVDYGFSVPKTDPPKSKPKSSNVSYVSNVSANMPDPDRGPLAPIQVETQDTFVGPRPSTKVPLEKSDNPLVAELEKNEDAWEGVAQAGRDLSADALSQGPDMVRRGDYLGAGLTAVGATAIRTGVGFYEGLSFYVRPVAWVNTIKGLWALGTSGEARGEFMDTVRRDPLGFTNELSGSIAGGYLGGKALGSVVDKIKGPTTITQEITGVKVGVSDKGPTLQATLKEKTLPRGYIWSTGDDVQFKGLVGTTEGPVKQGLALTDLAPETLDTLFTKKPLSLIDRAKVKLGVKPKPDLMSKVAIADEVKMEIYSSTPETDFLRSTGPRTIERGKSGGFSSFKEMGPEGPWVGEGSKFGALETLDDGFRMKVVGGIADDAKVGADIVDDVNRIAPQPGPKTSLNKLYGALDDAKVDDPFTQSKSISEAKEIMEFIKESSGPTSPLVGPVKPTSSGVSGAGSILSTELESSGAWSMSSVSRTFTSSSGYGSVGAGVGGALGGISSITKPQPKGPGFMPRVEDYLDGSRRSPKPFMGIISKPESKSRESSGLRDLMEPIQGPKAKPLSRPWEISGMRDIIEPIQGPKSKPYEDTKYKQFFDTIIEPIQGPKPKPLQDTKHKPFQDTKPKPPLVIPPPPPPTPGFPSPKPMVKTYPTRKTKKKKTQGGLGGLENRRHSIATPKQILGNMNKKGKLRL